MANPTPPIPPAQPRNWKLVIRTFAIVLLPLTVLGGLTVLIVSPKRPVYTIQNASIRHFNLTNNRLSATFELTIKAHNRNPKVSLYYDKVEVELLYEDVKVAFHDMVEPFFLPHRNVGELKVKLVARDVLLFGAVARDLSIEKSWGKLELDIHMKANVRVKVGVWKFGSMEVRKWHSKDFNFTS